MGWLIWTGLGAAACLVMSLAVAGAMYAAGRADAEIERMRRARRFRRMTGSGQN